jgi:propanediol utilization protein
MKLLGSVNVGLSAAHLHPSAELLLALFGTVDLPIKRKLTLGVCFVYTERVIISGPTKTELSVALLGPPREPDKIQLELSPAQTRLTGIKAPYRQSGNLANTPGFFVRTAANKDNLIQIDHGAIISDHHAHLRNDFGSTQSRLTIVAQMEAGLRWICELPVRYSNYACNEIHIDKEIGLKMLLPSKVDMYEQSKSVSYFV